MIQNLTWNLLSIPFISAFIGWLTNWIAIKMLFRPRTPKYLFGIRFEGLLPRRRSEITDKVADLVCEELVTSKDFAEILREGAADKEIEKMLDEEVERFVSQVLGKHTMFQRFLAGEVTGIVSTLFSGHFRKTVPRLREKMISHVQESVDVRGIVRDKLNSFELEKLEALINRLSSHELRMIEIWGGVLGFLVGIVQVVIVLT